MKNRMLSSKISQQEDALRIVYHHRPAYEVSQKKVYGRKMKMLVQAAGEQNLRLMNFADIVSHNLRTHLTNFFLLIDFIEKENEAAEKEKLFALFKNAVTELSDTVENLKGMVTADIQRNKRTEHINLRCAIEKTQDNIRALLIENNVQCINEADGSLDVHVIPAYLDSILLNFFTNSIKYKSPQRALLITICAEKENDFVKLSFSDNGSGIDLEKHGQHLFGMYQTFHGNDDARGIGLFITKNQIEAMGGKITVKSAVNEGTAFKIWLPA